MSVFVNISCQPNQPTKTLKTYSENEDLPEFKNAGDKSADETFIALLKNTSTTQITSTEETTSTKADASEPNVPEYTALHDEAPGMAWW